MARSLITTLRWFTAKFQGERILKVCQQSHHLAELRAPLRLMSSRYRDGTFFCASLYSGCIPATDQGRRRLFQTRTALDRRLIAPARNRPVTASTARHSFLTYLLSQIPCRLVWVRCRRANRGNGVWRRNCVQICLRGATHKLLSDVEQFGTCPIGWTTTKSHDHTTTFRSFVQLIVL